MSGQSSTIRSRTDGGSTVLVRSLQHLIDAHAAQIGEANASFLINALLDAKDGKRLAPESEHRVMLIRAQLADRYHHG